MKRNDTTDLFFKFSVVQVGTETGKKVKEPYFFSYSECGIDTCRHGIINACALETYMTSLFYPFLIVCASLLYFAI